MTAFATVVFLVGQVWAQTATGLRRLLKEGDRLAADEILVTTAGAQISLDFGQNLLITFEGTQLPAVNEEATDATIATQAVSVLPALHTDVESPSEAEAVPTTHLDEDSSNVFGGHGFVQLVRIHEIIEADGISFLTLAHIEKLLLSPNVAIPEWQWEEDYRDEPKGEECFPTGIATDNKPADNLPPVEVTPMAARTDDDASDISLDISGNFNDAVSGKQLVYQAADLPAGLTIDPNTGVISGKIDTSASQGGNTGTQGEYNVTITVTDPAGNSSAHDFTWTVNNPAPVAADDGGEVTAYQPLVKTKEQGVLSNDSDPDNDSLAVIEVSSDNEPGNTSTPGVNGELIIQGQYGQLTLHSDGSYHYQRATGTAGGKNDIFRYTVNDGEGGTATATLTISIADAAPTVTIPAAGNASTTVYESGLANGSESGTSKATTSGTISFTSTDGLGLVKLGGHELTTVDKTFADGLTAHYEYDPITGEGTIHYGYTLQAATHGDDTKVEFEVEITDADGDAAPAGKLVISIVDDEPEAADDRNSVTEDSGVTATGNVIGGAGASSGDKADTLGADGANVTGITSNNVSGNTASTNADGDLIIDGEYGTLTISPDGSYSYELDNNNPDVNALKTGISLTESFTYTLTDGDGDTAAAELDITIDGNADGVPSIAAQDENGTSVDGHITVKESGLPDGTDASNESESTNGTITITAPDGLQSITVGGQSFTLTQLSALSNTSPSTAISVAGGTLVLTGFTADSTVGGVATAGTLNYSYTLTEQQKHSGANDDALGIPLSVTDAGNATTNGTLTVRVEDDAPTAVVDTGNVSEGATLT
uniref:Ig-like domain-containing protein n=1 Tax=Oceanisphaera sp. TaxID=1929979 RepID=UPI003A92AD76